MATWHFTFQRFLKELPCGWWIKKLCHKLNRLSLPSIEAAAYSGSLRQGLMTEAQSAASADVELQSLWRSLLSLQTSCLLLCVCAQILGMEPHSALIAAQDNAGPWVPFLCCGSQFTCEYDIDAQHMQMQSWDGEGAGWCPESLQR